MIKPIKPILFAVIVLAATVSAVYTLNLLDQVVNGLTYTYGDLNFDLRWANPYWNFLHILQILLGVIATSTVVNIIFTVKEYVSIKKPSAKATPSQKPAITVSQPTIPSTTVPAATHSVEKPAHVQAAPSTLPSPPAPLPATPPAPASLPADISGLAKCFHCGKLFSQPLRMLDFQGDRPRIVNICPFCNEIIPSSPRQDEGEQDKKLQFKKKSNNHTPKTLASQPTS